MDTLNELTYDVSRLVGKYVTLLPYARGYVPRGTLYHLWKTLEDEGLTDFVFHTHLENGTPYKTTGDLVEFMNMFSTEAKRFLLIALSKDGGKIVGAFWIEDWIPKRKGSVAIFMCKGHRGEAAEETAKIGCEYAFNALDLKMLWAFTPWLHAANLARKVGFQDIVSLPEMLPQETKSLDLHILRLKREEFLYA